MNALEHSKEICFNPSSRSDPLTDGWDIWYPSTFSMQSCWVSDKLALNCVNIGKVNWYVASHDSDPPAATAESVQALIKMFSLRHSKVTFKENRERNQPLEEHFKFILPTIENILTTFDCMNKFYKIFEFQEDKQPEINYFTTFLTFLIVNWNEAIIGVAVDSTAT